VFGGLSGDRHYDVAIIGGGYTGLSTARYLARCGVSSVVLEASRIGWGASGRNGGVVSGKFRIAFSEIAERFGLETARRMHDLGIEAIEHVGELVADYGIASADYRPTGSLRCATMPSRWKA
jgi:gamma-glutamylputrescine oxidase